MSISCEHLVLVLLTALTLTDKKEHQGINGYRLDTSGSARERLDLAKRILAEVPLIDGFVLFCFVYFLYENYKTFITNVLYMMIIKKQTKRKKCFYVS